LTIKDLNYIIVQCFTFLHVTFYIFISVEQ